MFKFLPGNHADNATAAGKSKKNRKNKGTTKNKEAQDVKAEDGEVEGPSSEQIDTLIDTQEPHVRDAAKR